MTDTPKPVKAWGLTNYAGDTMKLAFPTKAFAEWYRRERWPRDFGKSRAIQVLITPIGKDQ